MSGKFLALSSAMPDVPITEREAVALLQNLRRCEALWLKYLTDPQNANARIWGCAANVELRWSVETSAVDSSPDAVIVQLVAALPDGTPDGVIAYHTLDAQLRPLCLISYVAAGNDWVSAASHEIQESRVDATCTATAQAPDGSWWDLEVCDPVEGSDYEENGIMVANGVGPRYFFPQDTGPLDIVGAVSASYQELPTGYHVANGVEVFGERVSDAKRAHVLADHGRPGLRRKARAA